MSTHSLNLINLKSSKFNLYKNNIFLLNFNLNKYLIFNSNIPPLKYFTNFNYIFLYFKFFFNNIYYVLFLLKYFYKKYIYLITVGLGFKKDLYRIKKRIRRKRQRNKKSVVQYYIGNRHNLAYRVLLGTFITRFKRSYFVFFSNSKKQLFLMSSSFKSSIKDSYFKLRGLFLKRTRIKRRKIIRWLFARRVRFRNLKLKLSKKQKFA